MLNKCVHKQPKRKGKGIRPNDYQGHTALTSERHPAPKQGSGGTSPTQSSSGQASLDYGQASSSNGSPGQGPYGSA